MKPQIDIHRLSLTLGDREVLKDIDLSFGSGQLVALLGPNGAGKTSLLRCLAGLIPIDRGKIDICGDNLMHLHRWQRARHLAYLEQDANCHWPMAVEDVVALGRLPYHLGGSELGGDHKHHIDRALEESDLLALRQRQVNSLSGGERRRVMLARTLATRTQVILADEPIAGLDPAHQLQMMELLSARAKAGVLVIVVLHDPALAGRYCDRLIFMKTGQVIADGNANAVLTSEILETTYGIKTHIEEIQGLPVIIPLNES